MVTEEGTVKSLNGDKASVLIKKSPMCESCGHSSSCCVPGDTGEFEIEAANPLKAKIGDSVTVTMESSPMIKVTVVIYLLPVISLIGGIIAGQYAGKKLSLDRDLCSIVSGLLLFVLPFFAIKPLMSRLEKQKRYTPEITGIIAEIKKST